MLWDHFNRLLGYRFSWVCRMRDEAGSWEGVLRNNTECSIPFLQSREAADKLRHTREENTHTIQYDTYIQINYLSALLDPHQPHTLTPIFPLSLVQQSKSFFLFFFLKLEWQKKHIVVEKPCVRQMVYYPHSFHCILFTRSSRGTEIDLECLFKYRWWPTEKFLL